MFVAVVALGVPGLASCGSSGTPGAVQRVSLAQLAAHQDHYSGDRVTTTGTVRRFGHGADVYYVIEDAAHNRVEVRPGSLVADRVGSEVTVTGRFDFDDARGRTLRGTSVRPAT